VDPVAVVALECSRIVRLAGDVGLTDLRDIIEDDARAKRRPRKEAWRGLGTAHAVAWGVHLVSTVLAVAGSVAMYMSLVYASASFAWTTEAVATDFLPSLPPSRSPWPALAAGNTCRGGRARGGTGGDSVPAFGSEWRRCAPAEVRREASARKLMDHSTKTDSSDERDRVDRARSERGRDCAGEEAGLESVASASLRSGRRALPSAITALICAPRAASPDVSSGVAAAAGHGDRHASTASLAMERSGTWGGRDPYASCTSCCNKESTALLQEASGATAALAVAVNVVAATSTAAGVLRRRPARRGPPRSALRQSQ
jgi:hypothetical protein